MAYAKIFKDVTGVSLGKYIRERLLAGAVYQLRSSDSTIFDIALDFGFGSQSHFTYMFRKHYGITPYDFRQNTDIDLNIALPLHAIHQNRPDNFLLSLFIGNTEGAYNT